jgi:hypothetical protein
LTRRSYNKIRQLLWLLPVVILIDMQVVNPITRTWSISYITMHHITSFWPYHITRHMLQKQVRRPLICSCKFLRGCYRFLARTFLTYATTTTWYANCYLPFIRTLFIESDPTKVGETDTRQPPYASSACQSVEPVSRKRTCKVGPGRFIPQYRRIKIRLVTASKLSNQRPQQLCSTRAWNLRIDLAHDATVGERCMKIKIFPMKHPRSNLGDA